ncbi:Transcription accessory protein (S1RNA-binding domain) [Streptococcus sp. HSISS1]|nr:Transcription accessory protein (S1RNA-binding domain) [Streptococcus sp. HSISS1]
MENRNFETLAQELGLKKQQVETVLELTAEGNTIPFIARYRKEKPEIWMKRKSRLSLIWISL